MRSAVRVLLLQLLVVILGVGLAAAQKDKAEAKQVTLQGIVSDAACGATHKMMGDMTSAECTRACVKMGSKFALVVGKKVYTLEGKSDELDKLAGEEAEVTGKLSGDTVQVESVKKA